MAGRSKGLEKFDRNGVVQHRNHVCEIALRKTISTFQKEGKMLEKELREIAKVRETLRQIRAPLRRKVFEASLTDPNESDGDERKSAQSLRSRMISTNSTSDVRTFEADNNKRTPANRQRKQNTAKEDPDVYRSKTSFSNSSGRLRESSTNSARKVSNRRAKQSVSHSQAPRPEALETDKLRRQKISAPAHLGIKTTNAARAPPEGFLPPISPNTSGNSPRSTRRTPEVISTCGSDNEDDGKTNTRSLVSLSRAESLRCSPLTPIPRGRGIIDPEEEKSLTMEETLRIKGKFRQIGHSIIATALLKGLRQKGQLTSEAIHNLHKPVSVNSEQKKEEKEGSDVEEKRQDDESKESSANENISKFRAAARKTININRLIGVQLSRRRPESDPVSRPANPVEVDSASRRNSEEKTEAVDGEEETRDAVKSAVGNPLMNAHIARRRKFGVTAQAVIASNFLTRARSAASTADVSRDQAHNDADDSVTEEVRVARNSGSGVGSAGVKEPSDVASKQAVNACADGNVKTVRFKLDAWQ